LLPAFDPVVVAAVAACAGISALVDLRIRRVPNPLTLAIAVLGITLAATGHGIASPWAALEGCAVGLLAMMPGYLIGATGGGDVKLVAAMGTMLGPRGVLFAVLYTAIAGGLLALIVATRRRRLRDTMERTAALVRTGGANAAEIEHGLADNRFAYAPAIAIGSLAVALGF
jgi:prepilin peptidase CpaA